MRVLRAGILGRCLLLHACQVACGAAGLFTRFHRMTEGERFCCGDLVDGSADMVTVGDQSMIPLACFEHKAGCPALRFEFPVDLGTGTPSKDAIQEQLDLRSQPTCEATEWKGRCPSGSTMLLANQRGGCFAAGCIELEGADPAVMGKEGEEELHTLRAVVAQEFRRLAEASTGAPPSFHEHSIHLREAFVEAKSEHRRQLKAVLASRQPDRSHRLQLLLEEALGKGFDLPDVAGPRVAVEIMDSLKRLRSAPGIVLPEVARDVFNVTAEAITNKEASKEIITSPEHEVQDLPGTADELEHAEQAEVAVAAEARDGAEANPDSCSPRAIGETAEYLEGGEHPPPANNTELPPQDEPDGESAPEFVFDRASAVCPHVQDMMTLFTNEMDDIMKQHDAEVEGLRQHVLDVEYSSAALEKRAKSAEEYAQMMEEYGMMQEKRVTVAVKTICALVLAFPLPLFFACWRRQEREPPPPSDEEARGAEPPLPLPPESAQGAAAARARGLGNVQDSGVEEVLVPPTDFPRGIEHQEQDAGRVAAVLDLPMVDARNLERGPEGEAAPLAGLPDEPYPAEGSEGGFASAVDADAAPLVLANDAGAGPASHIVAWGEEAIPPPPAVGAAGAAGSELVWSFGLEWWVNNAWRRGMIEASFLNNVAETKGANSAELNFAKAIRTDAWGALRRHSTLGRGGYGAVYMMERTDAPGEYVAVKCNRGLTGLANPAAAAMEMAIFDRTTMRPHKNVVHAMAINETLPDMPIVMPLGWCDLRRFLRTYPSRIKDRLSLVVDLARGAAHMHSIGFVHRDIKPDNLLVFRTDSGLQGKITDFSLSREIGETCQPQMGTPGYMAYESMSTRCVVAAAAHDVVSVAVVLLEACLKEDQLCPNLFTRKAMLNQAEKTRLQAIYTNQDPDQAFMDRVAFECDVARRTMTDGTFKEWLTPDKFHPAISWPWELTKWLPSFLATNPAERNNMHVLRQLAAWTLDQANGSAGIVDAHTPVGVPQQRMSAGSRRGGGFPAFRPHQAMFTEGSKIGPAGPRIFDTWLPCLGTATNEQAYVDEDVADPRGWHASA